jgi:hypothetical protein
MMITDAAAFRRSVLWTLTFFCFAAVAQADDTAQPVWLVSTRHLLDCGAADEASAKPCYWRRTETDGWSSSDSADFHAADAPGVPTVVFVHGNDTDADDAVARGCVVRQSIRSEVGDRAFRFVVWSWPSDRILRRHRNDVPIKAARSDVESCFLAAWLAELRPDVKVGLIGHSFGPRVILGAMHLLAGGDIDGRTLPPETVAAWTTKRRLVRATLLAAAEDADWLAPDGRHGRATAALDETLIAYNPCDRVLRWYPRLYGRGGPQALGAVGPDGLDDAAARKTRLFNVAPIIGKSHDYQCWCSAVSSCGLWARYAFLDENVSGRQNAHSSSLIANP